jgi:molecular chaperone DnaJ
MSKKDYYETLGVERSAEKATIKKAYRKIAMKFHPDKNPDNPEAEAKFKEASVAAEVLLDEQKRQKYDQFGHAAFEGGAGGPGGFGGGSGGGDFGDLGDIFGDIFGDILGGGRRRSGPRPRMGADLQAVLDVSFEEAAFGIEKEITVTKHTLKPGTKPETCSSCGGTGEVRRQQGFFTISQGCPPCGGTGEVVQKEKKRASLSVKVPAGIDNGQRLKLSGEGEVGSHGGPSGDLYVLIRVKNHDIFERDGFEVYCEVPISFSQSALGSEVEVPTLSGKVAVNIPAGTQSGKKMRLKAKGIAKLGGYGFGDQIIDIHVETPTKLSAREKELFGELAELEYKSTPMSKGFFDKVKNLFQ